ncbi:hypothetical protein [Micromonospora sp. KC721]|uniref:hypothetical protein n=1 Tax=Micromonospora sp. KC721 TaxID=2530380 RepID=UPI0010445ADB|nr:hypothetical protein [Micromonospora sp. KC721]TDB79422.1 hypothetical protein E1182_12805 [Micromonospora sp. KC721]
MTEPVGSTSEFYTGEFATDPYPPSRGCARARWSVSTSPASAARTSASATASTTASPLRGLRELPVRFGA